MTRVVDHRRKRRATMRNTRGAIGRPSIDVQRLAQAVAGPGIDTRTWLVSGTVGSRDESGAFRTDVLVEPTSGPRVPEAAFADRRGLVVDVRLEPSGDFVTARYNGIGCGRFGKMLIPIRGGDEVLVAIPDGDMNSPAITIVAVASNQTAQIPADWNNDRVLFDLAVPLEIKGPAVSITSLNLQLNGRPVTFTGDGI